MHLTKQWEETRPTAGSFPVDTKGLAIHCLGIAEIARKLSEDSSRAMTTITVNGKEFEVSDLQCERALGRPIRELRFTVVGHFVPVLARTDRIVSIAFTIDGVSCRESVRLVLCAEGTNQTTYTFTGAAPKSSQSDFDARLKRPRF